MKSENYIRLNEFIKSHDNIKKAVIFIDKNFPKPVVFIFYSMLSFLVLKKDKRVFVCAAIPWIDFYLVTKLRNKINRKRPFESIGFEPVLMHSKGKSCPSRHASSSVIITFAVYFISPFFGIITGIISFFVCFSRILTGVHYISDVIAGMAISVFIGTATFFGILQKK